MELLVCRKGLSSVIQVILHLGAGHAQLARPLQGGLNLLSDNLDLLLLRVHEALECLDRRFLGGGGLCKTLGHLVAHLLQDSDDLAALGRILGTLLAFEEGQHLITVVVQQSAATRHDKLAQDAHCARLQEGTRHALFQCLQGLCDCLAVGTILSLVSGIGRSLLLTKGSRLCHGLFRRDTVILRLCQVPFNLQLLLVGLFDVGLQRRNLGLCGFDGRGEITAAVLAIAHELVVKLLLLGALFGDLRLHCLQHCHNFPDGIRDQRRPLPHAMRRNG
mmetsp:Transcript_15206/g.41561  ORF Transcript_15206/g.41561 Transcript_15206/m.41561 type:complete len:276 (+) Transcript_15206:589-1416(+)